jgi:hypothetical protein
VVLIAIVAARLANVEAKVKVDINLCLLTGLCLETPRRTPGPDPDAIINAAAATGVTLTLAAAAQITRRCQQLALDPANGTNPCGGKIFVSGGDYMTATQHDLSAISGGSPALLNRIIPSWPRGWLASQWECFRPPFSGKDCDEYPFASSAQGGQFNGPSLKLIPIRDNRGQGSALGRFYGRCNVWFGGLFAVVPVPNPGVPTFGICTLNSL